MVSRIESIEKILRTSGKHILFVLNNDLAQAGIYSLWRGIIGDSKVKLLEFDLEPGKLYSAFRGYLENKNVKCLPHGALSMENMLRVEDTGGAEIAEDFWKNVEWYNELQNKTHSFKSEEKLMKFRSYLEKLASNYK